MFQGLEEMPEVLADPRSLREAYLREFENYRRRVESAALAQQMDYRVIRTDMNLGLALSAYLAGRMQQVK
jgi:hypothetical protein